MADEKCESEACNKSRHRVKHWLRERARAGLETFND